MPISSTPTKMVSIPGSPKPGPSLPETAAAWVGFVDLVTGLFQFESVEGATVDKLAPAAVVTASVGVPPAADSPGSGARVETGAGAVSAGSGGAGGAGAGGAVGSSKVGFGRGVRGFGSGSDRPGRQIRPQVGGVSDASAFAGATAQRPAESTKTAAAAVAGMARRADGNCFIDTFSTARGPLRASLVLPESLLQLLPGVSYNTRGNAKSPGFAPLHATLPAPP